jgi:hypothetical protein
MVYTSNYRDLIKNLRLIYEIKGFANWVQYVKTQQIKLTLMAQNCHGLCDGPIPHPEESWRGMCVSLSVIRCDNNPLYLQ